MGTSVPTEPRWAPQASKAEKALWRWAVDQLDDRILVLPQVAITMRELELLLRRYSDLPF